MSEFLRLSSAAWSLLHVLVLFILFYKSRYSKKKTLIITCVTMLPLIALNVVLLCLLGKVLFGKLLLLTLVLPSFIYFFLMSKHRDFRFVFTFCIVDTISADIIVLSMVLDKFFTDSSHIVMFVIRVLAFPVIEFIAAKKLRNPYLEIQNTVKKGWVMFSFVSLLFYVTLLIFAAYPTVITERPDDMPVMILLLILMPLMYFNIFQIMYNQNKLYIIEREQELMKLQSGYMEKRISQTREAEKQISIERHDLRHRLKTIGEMLGKGEIEEAKIYINHATKRLDNTVTERYCTNPALDAVFSSYFKQAKDAEIEVESQLAVPDKISVDDTELSVVIANALENAINACMNVPKSDRIIKCRCVTKPQLMFQISNSFAGEVLLDDEGLPLSRKRDHGFGTRSILAFCERNGAFADYKVEDKMFHLRIVLPE